MSAWKSVVLTPEQQRAVVQFAVRGVAVAQAQRVQARSQELVRQHEAGYLALAPSGFSPARVVSALYQLAQLPEPQSPAPVRRGPLDLLEQVWGFYHTTGHTASTYDPSHAALVRPYTPPAAGEDLARRLATEDAERYHRQARRQASASAAYEAAQRQRPFDQAADQAAEVRLQEIRAAIRQGLEEGGC